METQVPKYVELSSKLETLIGNGEWSEHGRAPGVRAIASRFRVSIVTASRALQLLHERGVIETVDRSGSYLKENWQPNANEKWALYCRVTPGPWRDAGLELLRNGFRAALALEKVELNNDLFPIDPELSAADWQKMIRRAKRLAIQGAFFFPSRLDEANAQIDLLFLDVCRQEDFPVVLFERSVRDPARSREWDLVCADNLESGRMCARHLLEIGRKRIVMVIASPTSAHLDRAAGYLQTLHRAGIGFTEILELPIDLPGREAYGWTADRLHASKADGVICYHDYTAVGLIIELLSRRIRVPQDIAVIGFDNYSIGNTFSLGLTTISYPIEDIAQNALRLMRQRIANPKGTPCKILVPCDLIIRESTVDRPAAAPPSAKRVRSSENGTTR